MLRNLCLLSVVGKLCGMGYHMNKRIIYVSALVAAVVAAILYVTVNAPQTDSDHKGVENESISTVLNDAGREDDYVLHPGEVTL